MFSGNAEIPEEGAPYAYYEDRRHRKEYRSMHVYNLRVFMWKCWKLASCHAFRDLATFDKFISSLTLKASCLWKNKPRDNREHSRLYSKTTNWRSSLPPFSLAKISNLYFGLDLHDAYEELHIPKYSLVMVMFMLLGICEAVFADGRAHRSLPVSSLKYLSIC